MRIGRQGQAQGRSKYHSRCLSQPPISSQQTTMASLVAAKPCLVRPAAKAQRVVKPRHVALRATAPKKEDIAAAIAEAEETCQGGSTGEW